MKTTIIKTLSLLTLLLILITPTYATPEEDLLYVETEINNMSSSTNWIWIFWEILTRVFDTNWKIKSVFYDFIWTVSDWSVPYFLWGNLVESPITTDGTDVWIWTTTPAEKLDVVWNVKISNNLLVGNGPLSSDKYIADFDNTFTNDGANHQWIRVESTFNYTLWANRVDYWIYTTAIANNINENGFGYDLIWTYSKAEVSDWSTANNIYWVRSYWESDHTSWTVDTIDGIYGLGLNNESWTVGTIRWVRGIWRTDEWTATNIYGWDFQAQNLGIWTAVWNARWVTSRVYEANGWEITAWYSFYSDCDDAATCFGLYVKAWDAEVVTDWWVYSTWEDKNYFSGDVWIWTTTPGEKLDVNWKIKASSHIQSWANGWGVALTVNDWHGNASVTFNHMSGNPEQDGNAGRIEVNTDATSDAFMNFELKSNVTDWVAVAWNNIMRLQADGLVWIWTTSPLAKLHVDWNIISNDPTQDNHVATRSYVDSKTNLKFVDWTDILDAVYMDWNVWIWTTSPNYNLHVKGSGYPGILIESTDSSGGDLELKSSLGGYQLYMEWADLRFYDNNNSADRVTFESGGNVWIWTNAPSTKLEVNWNTNIIWNLEYDSSTFRNPTSWTIELDWEEDWMRYRFSWTSTPKWIRLDNYDTVWIELSRDWDAYFAGNVWIWTTAPGHKLDVNWNIRTSGRSLYFGTADQRIYWDNSTAFYVDSNSDTNVQMIFRDKQDKTYWRIYWSSDWANFWLMDWDGNRSYLAAKDNYTSFRINDSEKMRITSAWYVWIWTAAPAKVLDVVWTTRIVQSSTRDVRIEWLDSNGSSRNLAVLGDRWNDRLILNYGNEYSGGIYTAGRIVAGSFIYSSDERLKKNIETIDNPLENISKLRWVTFDWKKDGKAEIGLIAQEVEKVYPDLVEETVDWFKAVKYGNIVAILIEWVKELYNKVVWNSEKIIELENELEELKNDMKELKEIINELK